MSFGIACYDSNGFEILRLDEYGYCLIDSFVVSGGVSGHKDYPEFVDRTIFVTALKNAPWGGHNTSSAGVRAVWTADTFRPNNNYPLSSSTIYVFAR